MTYIPDILRDLVYQRAAGRCEYCLIHDDDTYKPHEVDHIVAEKHEGKTTEENLCLSCFDCNRHKGSDLASFDSESDSVIALFNPRRDNWEEHFALEGGVIQSTSAVGRVTARLLQMNTPQRIDERISLIKLGRYPR